MQMMTTDAKQTSEADSGAAAAPAVTSKRLRFTSPEGQPLLAGEEDAEAIAEAMRAHTRRNVELALEKLVAIRAAQERAARRSTRTRTGKLGKASDTTRSRKAG